MLSWALALVAAIVSSKVLGVSDLRLVTVPVPMNAMVFPHIKLWVEHGKQRAVNGRMIECEAN